MGPSSASGARARRPLLRPRCKPRAPSWRGTEPAPCPRRAEPELLHSRERSLVWPGSGSVVQVPGPPRPGGGEPPAPGPGWKCPGEVCVTVRALVWGEALARPFPWCRRLHDRAPGSASACQECGAALGWAPGGPEGDSCGEVGARRPLGQAAFPKANPSSPLLLSTPAPSARAWTSPQLPGVCSTGGLPPWFPCSQGLCLAPLWS